MISEKIKSSMHERTVVILIICGALIVGATLFTLLLSFITDWSDVEPINSPSLLSLMGVIFGGMMVILSFIVPTIMSKTMTRELSDRYASPDNYGKPNSKSLFEDETVIVRLLAAFQTCSIARYAMIEGAVFLNLMLFMIEHNLLNLIVAGIGLLIMLAMLPFAGRVWNWVETKVEGMEAHASGR